MRTVKIGSLEVGHGRPCYFVAEIGSNFDGEIDRARHLIRLAKECGANAAKFQSFIPEEIIRPEGFVNPEGFQARWSRPVHEVYRTAMLPREWHRPLKEYCGEVGIEFLSSPYDVGAVSLLDELGVSAHKMGSGEITNLQFLSHIARSGKPVILGTGASTFAEVARAVEVLRESGCSELILLQCITSYPSCIESAEIRAMSKMGEAFDCLVGYSDHSPGALVPIAAVCLGACMIEKHFTDDCSREGPDHPFAMEPDAFRSMVDQIKLLEKALGSGEKRVMEEEVRTRAAQRRGLWFVRDCAAGQLLTEDDIKVLRPAHGISPEALSWVVGMRLQADVSAGTPVRWEVLRGGMEST